MQGLERYRVALRLRVVLSTELLVVSLVLQELGALQLDRGSVSVVPSVAHYNGRGLPSVAHCNGRGLPNVAHCNGRGLPSVAHCNGRGLPRSTPCGVM